MISKYAGRCKLCGGPIKVGDEINYTKEFGASHIGCAEQGEILGESEAVELADRLGFKSHAEMVDGGPLRSVSDGN